MKGCGEWVWLSKLVIVMIPGKYISMVQFTYVPLALCKTFTKFRKNQKYFSSCKNTLFMYLN